MRSIASRHSGVRAGAEPPALKLGEWGFGEFFIFPLPGICFPGDCLFSLILDIIKRNFIAIGKVTNHHIIEFCNLFQSRDVKRVIGIIR